jgi:hypothetical protein
MMADDEKPSSPPWSRYRECVGVISWTSFLAACVETLAFFAYFDPMVLGCETVTPPWLAYRPAAYAVGFFFFWTFTFIGSTLTAYMLDTSHNAPPKLLEPHK